MKKYIKCKVCGFIMEEKDDNAVCPACGVPHTAFVEYKYTISEKRRALLSLHIHPITVHFPEAISIMSVALLALAFITSGTLSANLITTMKVLLFLLPFSVVVAIYSGIYDARLRFKKLSPPHLKIKIYLGIALLVSSIITAVLIQSDS